MLKSNNLSKESRDRTLLAGFSELQMIGLPKIWQFFGI
jgi:hypothetical protein